MTKKVKKNNNKKNSKKQTKLSAKSKSSISIKNKKNNEYVTSGVPGFDKLLEKGIPKGYTLLVAGGAGAGKTILCMQILAHNAKKGKKCLYLTFEESEERLIEHMTRFGWNPEKLIKEGKLKVKRINPFDVTRNVEGMIEKEKGDLLIDLDPVFLPKNFKAEFIVIDSLTSIASAFTKKEDGYRIYVQQLFRFFEKLGITTFLITETKQNPEIYSAEGIEEFLADGVVVIYNFMKNNSRKNGIEILKMRGENHKKKIVAMEKNDKGIKIFPNREVFGKLS